MEELTLENIVSYLPYGLKIDASYYDNEEYSTVVGFNDTDLIVWNGQWASTYGKKIEQDYYIGHVKPVLRPMKLTIPIFIDDEEIIPVCEICRMIWGKQYYEYRDYDEDNLCDMELTIISLSKDQETLTLDIAFFLFTHKFDVFGLIEKGLAIDCNTLENNPYE